MASQLERAKIFRDNDGICHICTRKIAVGEPWHDEHVKPKGLKGSNDLSNRKPAHIDCHAGKTRQDVAIMRKADRQLKRHVGVKRTSHPMPGSRKSKFKKHVDGSVSIRTQTNGA